MKIMKQARTLENENEVLRYTLFDLILNATSAGESDDATSTLIECLARARQVLAFTESKANRELSDIQSQEFYELMQAYRWKATTDTYGALKAFEAVKDFCRRLIAEQASK